MTNKTDQEKSDYIRQCFEDGEKDYTHGDCIDGRAFLDSLDAQIELEEDEEDRKMLVERENSPTIKVTLDKL
ncbi:hypothetical protein I6Z00_004249 [Vibrio parahaemolyticus]|nr:hypothetical protein [Vibrio parahaemolyticus]